MAGISVNDNEPPERPRWFDEALLAHEPYIRSRIAALEKAIDKREDHYQEVLVRALEKWAKYRRDGNFAGWLYWIVFKTVTKKDRSASHGPAIYATQPNQEHAADLALALEFIPHEVVLSACGHSEKDIAAQFGVTGPAIHYRIARARAAAANDNNKKAA